MPPSEPPATAASRRMPITSRKARIAARSPRTTKTARPPAPSAKRCLQFGQTLAALIREYPGDQRVVIAASGGLSHTKIDEALDRNFIAALKGQVFQNRRQHGINGRVG